MTQVRIYRPARTAMQSGQANAKEWLLEYEQASRREADPLMGWTSSADTRQQLRLYFDTKEEAVAFAQKRGLMYTVVEPHGRAVKPKSYSANFAYDRPTPWTH